MHLNLLSLSQKKIKQHSIGLITSKNKKRSDFGSAFIIKREKNATYWLTCAHVILDVDGANNVLIDGRPATLVGLKNEELSIIKKSYDLAVLRSEYGFDKYPLTLEIPQAKKYKNSYIFGCCEQNGIDTKFQQEILANLEYCNSSIITHGGDRSRAWEVTVNNNSKHYLKPGFSGSPVFNQKTGKVIGVVTISSTEKGEEGLAISIEVAKKVFQKIPELRGLLSVKQKAFLLKILEKSRDFLDKHLLKGVTPQTRECIDWLSDTRKLAEEAGDYALKNSSKLSHEFFGWTSQDSKEKYLQEFYWEIERYLELVYTSMIVGDVDLLTRQPIARSLPLEVYEVAFFYIEKAIPESIDSEVNKKLKEYINCLITNIL